MTLSWERSATLEGGGIGGAWRAFRVALRLPPLDMPAGNTDSGLLKCLAILTMMIDHVGAAFFPGVIEWRVIGRLALPLYMWCAVIGCCRTRDFGAYLMRLLIVGALSQPWYVLGMRHPWHQMNVFCILFLGVFAIAGIRVCRYGSFIWAPVVALLISAIVAVDYGWKAVLLMILLFLCRESRASVASVMVAFCLYWGQGTFTLTALFGVSFAPLLAPLPSGLKTLLQATQKLQFCALLALPLMLIPTGNHKLLPKWAAYAAYPAHLFIIYLIRLFV